MIGDNDNAEEDISRRTRLAVELPEDPDPPWNPPPPVESAAPAASTLVVNQETVGEKRIGRIGLQVVDEDLLVDRGNALDRLGAEPPAVKGEDAIADLQRFQGLERAVADIEGVLRRDVNRDVPRRHDLVLVHLVSHHAPDPGDHRLAR